MSRNIYLDCHATTPCDPEVVDAMQPFFTDSYANPSSTDHLAGRSVAKFVEQARVQVAELINADSSEIIFTSGATESNNLAITGLTLGNRSNRKHLITSVIEHKAVLAPCKQAEDAGYELTILQTDAEGTVDVEALADAMRPDTLLVSLQAANNEIGTIQPVGELARIVRESGALFHCDAAQAAGKIPIDVDDLGVDLLSLSAHKKYGPKGIGALYIRGGPRALPIRPLTVGGGHEYELRPGTLNVPAIVGFGCAAKLCIDNISEETGRIRALRDRLENTIVEVISDIVINGSISNRLPNNSSITLPGIDAEALISNVPELAISTGSACTSGAIGPSYVLQGIGLTRDEADATIRIGVGRFNTETDINEACKALIKAKKRMDAAKLEFDVKAKQ